MEVIGWDRVRAGSIVWQPGPASFALTMVAKVTFRLMPGESPLDDEPEDIYASDSYWDDNRSRSLVQATDLSPGKARPEVLLVGSAYAPDHVPVRSLCARLRMGSVDKSIRVHGDRWFEPDGRPSDPRPFTRLPLSWERAAGGPDTDNPVGIRTGSAATTDRWGRAQAPNQELLGALASNRSRVIPPAGFGPIAPAWQPRASRLAYCAPSWDPEKWAEGPLPREVDFGYWNVAPADQHLSALRGDEPIFLENLDRRHAQLSTRLAKVEVRARLDATNGASRGLPLSPDTMMIDTDRGIATLLFRGSTLLEHPHVSGRILVEVVPIANRGQPHDSTVGGPAPVLEASELPPRENIASAESDAAMTMAPTFGQMPSPTLPFASPFLETAADETLRVLAPRQSMIPFFPLSSSAGETMIAGFEQLQPSLPFGPPAEAPRPDTFEWTGGAAPGPEIESATGLDDATIAPPPMIGPLATEGMAVPRKKEGPVDAPAFAEPPESPAVLPAVSASAPPLPLVEVPLERCAALDASIAHRPEDTGAILKTAQLDAATWSRVKAHHLTLIRAEMKRGKTALLGEYDTAYVGQLEKERGPLAGPQFAKILVHAERGEPSQAAKELKLPLDAIPRIHRRWIAKMASEPAVAASVWGHLASARAE